MSRRSRRKRRLKLQRIQYTMWMVSGSHAGSLDVTHTVKSCPSSVACLGVQIPCLGRGQEDLMCVAAASFLSCCLSSFVREAFLWGFRPIYGDTVSSFVWSISSFSRSSIRVFLPLSDYQGHLWLSSQLFITRFDHIFFHSSMENTANVLYFLLTMSIF